MPRPQPKPITFTIDGREVAATDGQMLVDAAKNGDVEIPVFCYEPKLGQPVGACRMCLVEIEGIPKLQTGCSTPVKDGMVVHTQTERVKEAQNAVVEFLLVNHPLDCPVCDKGGECPLQDITFGWGRGFSRFTEPKRHFVKPLELSPLIAIDRERCILCYRCVRFSQEVAEDYQLVLQERGADSYVSTFDGHPYVAPFSGNIIELCPVGALTSIPYRFRARPWDIEQSGSVCTLCPAQCNVSLTVRDDRVLRVLARDNDAVDDGWLCDKGRFAYQAAHADERITQPWVRDGEKLRPASWERAMAIAAAAVAKARGRAAALAGGGATNEEGFLLQTLVREGLGSGDVDCRVAGGPSRELALALAAPGLSATVADLEFAHTVLLLDCDPVDDAPIIELRLRKGIRRCGVQLAVASARPTALDGNAALVARHAPGGGEAFLCELVAALGGGDAGDDARAIATRLRDGGQDVVIVYGERLLAGAGADNAATALLALADALGLDGRDGAGLLEIPAHANGRGLREVGVLPHAGPGYGAVAAGRDAAGIAAAGAAGELGLLYLLDVDPTADLPGAAQWRRALAATGTVIAHASTITADLAEHATVVFPVEAYAEQEGTVTHPDGRLQRVRPAIGHGGEVRPGWWVLGELCKAAGLDLGPLTSSMVSARVFDAVPFYGGLDLDQVGGRGVRWQEREQASALPAGASAPFTPAAPAGAGGDGLRLGTFRSIWAAPEVGLAPALAFMAQRQRAELSPADAQTLGVREGQLVTVAVNGYSVEATVALRSAVPQGSVFLQEGLPEGAANELTGDGAGVAEVRPA